MPGWTLPLAALLLAPAATSAGGHPDVGTPTDPDACLSCHAEATPEVVREWEGGSHGLVLVKCFVCHGSTGKDFAREPALERCRGCHAEEVASVSRKGKAQRCFACHAPHALATKDGAKRPHTQP